MKALTLGLFAVSLAGNVLGIAFDASWWCVPALLLGWYLADLVSGVVHMALDYRPCADRPGLAALYFYTGSRASDEYQDMLRKTLAGIGPFERLVYDFKNHHPRPDALGRRSLWRQIGASVLLGALPLTIALNLAFWLFGLPGWTVAIGFALSVGGGLAQYFHGTLHRSDVPPPIRAMRRLGLLMTPEAHRRHHDTLQRDFSTNSGWSNALLNRFFDAQRQRGRFADHGLEPRH